MSSITSIYIPRMSVNVTEDQVIMEFDKFRIGQVRRVDFTPIVKRPGFGADVDSVVKSAFVHFRHYYYNELTLEIMRKIIDGESHRIRPACSTNEYWLLLKSTNPIPDTMMNPAQIVENCRILENKVDAQALTIEKLEEKLERVHSVVYQLLGGLYCHEKQSQSLDGNIDVLFNTQTATEEVPDTSEWGGYPTTRQGDECERRLAVLEEELAALRLDAESDELEEEEEDDEEDSLSDSGRDWARITPSQDEFDYAISLSSQISKLSLELPEDFDETFEQNLGQLHLPTPSPNGSYGSIIKPSCEYDFESDDDDMNISASTHSSMPGLIRAATESGDDDDDDDMSVSSMPGLIPIGAAADSDDDDSESRKRRRMSQELCGNE
jgi:hypothetical protein